MYKYMFVCSILHTVHSSIPKRMINLQALHMAFDAKAAAELKLLNAAHFFVTCTCTNIHTRTYISTHIRTLHENKFY